MLIFLEKFSSWKGFSRQINLCLNTMTGILSLYVGCRQLVWLVSTWKQLYLLALRKAYCENCGKYAIDWRLKFVSTFKNCFLVENNIIIVLYYRCRNVTQLYFFNRNCALEIYIQTQINYCASLHLPNLLSAH